jgi:hypothetical protein
LTHRKNWTNIKKKHICEATPKVTVSPTIHYVKQDHFLKSIRKKEHGKIKINWLIKEVVLSLNAKYVGLNFPKRKSIISISKEKSMIYVKDASPP